MELFTVNFESYDFEILADTDCTVINDSDYSQFGYGKFVKVNAEVCIKRDDVIASLKETIYDGCDEAFDGETYTMADGATFTVDDLLDHAVVQITAKVKDRAHERGW